jgi:hypothetical protein
MRVVGIALNPSKDNIPRIDVRAPTSRKAVNSRPEGDFIAALARPAE